MKLGEVMRIINGKPITRTINSSTEVESVFGADLMSDVLLCAQEDTLLVTGVINPQVVRTAEMVSCPAIIFVRCKIPLPETITLAEEHGISLIGCKYTLFETCGRLYRAGLTSCEIPQMTMDEWRARFEKE
jgi:hypothetical protein